MAVRDWEHMLKFLLLLAGRVSVAALMSDRFSVAISEGLGPFLLMKLSVTQLSTSAPGSCCV